VDAKSTAKMAPKLMMADVMTDDKEDRRYPSETHRRQRGKNLAMLVVLVGLVVLFYVVAIVRMGGN